MFYCRAKTINLHVLLYSACFIKWGWRKLLYSAITIKPLNWLVDVSKTEMRIFKIKVGIGKIFDRISFTNYILKHFCNISTFVQPTHGSLLNILLLFLTSVYVYQLSCNSCSRLIKQWKLMQLTCKLSLVNSHATLVLVLSKQWKLMKLSCKLSLVNSQATLVLVWSSNESWRNSHVNSRLSTHTQSLFSFDQATTVDETYMFSV